MSDFSAGTNLLVNNQPISAANPLVSSVQGRTSSVALTPTVTASSAYAINNVVGGLLNFASIVDAPQSGLLESLSLTSKSVLTAGFKLYLFSANPTASTFADKVAPSIAAADVAKLVGVYTFGGADSGLGLHTLYNLDAIAKALVLTSTSLFGVLVTTGTPTFNSTSDLTITASVLKD